VTRAGLLLCRSLLGLSLLGPSLLCCTRASEPPAADKRELTPVVRTAPIALDGALLGRALRALEPHFPQPMTLLEVRATPTSVEMQLIVDQGVTALRYRENPAAPDAQLAVPTSVVDPPVQVPVYGNGNLAENGFSPSEIDLSAIASAFPVAQKAVDPTDGWIRELVVRRFLPFGNAIRARIYVESPRMSGSIDTNGKGIPLGPSKM
jgi:hypothetical protein